MPAKKTATPALVQEAVSEEATTDSVLATEFARRVAAASVSTQPTHVSVGQFAYDAAHLMGKIKTDVRKDFRVVLSDSALTKILEISMMWVLNNRQSDADDNLFPKSLTERTEEAGDADEVVVPPTNEIIQPIEEETP